MWTKRALGNISNSVLMRKVCGGDFNTIRSGCRSVRHLRNHSSPPLPTLPRLRRQPVQVEILLVTAAGGWERRSSGTARARPCCTGRTRPPAAGPSRRPCCPSAAAPGSSSRSKGRKNQPDTRKWLGRETGERVRIGVPLDRAPATRATASCPTANGRSRRSDRPGSSVAAILRPKRIDLHAAQQRIDHADRSVTRIAMGIAAGARSRSGCEPAGDHHVEIPMPSQKRAIHGRSLEPVVCGVGLSQAGITHCLDSPTFPSFPGVPTE